MRYVPSGPAYLSIREVVSAAARIAGTSRSGIRYLYS